MSDLREFGIEVSESADGVKYRLPLRPLGSYRWLGVFLILFGIAMAALPTWGMSGMFQGILGLQGNVAWVFAIVTLLFDVPFVLAGLAMIAFGLLLIHGRSSLEVTAVHLVSFEGIGSWGWTRRRPLDELRRLVVDRLTVKKNHKPIREGPLADLAALRAEFKTAKPLLVAPGYPHAWLRFVAEDIARRRPESGDTLGPTGKSARVQVVEEFNEDADLRDYPEQPSGSRVEVEHHPTGVVLTVPSAGLWRGSKGLFAFGLFWCAFMAVFTAIPFFAAFQDGMLIFVLFVIGFWGVGIGLLLAGINMGRRRAVLAVVDGTLMIYQTSIFRAKRHEWSADALAEIRTGPSGMEVNEAPVLELQILPKQGKKVGLLAGRDVSELRWLATVLRCALGLSNTQTCSGKVAVDPREAPSTHE
jgi:hypothetical protein